MPKKRTRKEQKKAAAAESSQLYELGREWGQWAYISVEERVAARPRILPRWCATADELVRSWADAPAEVLAAYDDPGGADGELIRGLCSALGELYLDETGVTAEQAVRAWRLQELSDDTVEAREALPKAVLEEYDGILGAATALQRAAWFFSPEFGAIEPKPDLSAFVEQFPEVFTRGAVQALRAAAIEATAGTEFDRFQFLANPPGVEALKSKALDLLRPYRLNAEQRDDARALLLDGELYFGDWLDLENELSEIVARVIPRVFEAMLDEESAAAIKAAQELHAARLAGLVKQGKSALASQFFDERKVATLHKQGAISPDKAAEFTDRGRRLSIWERQALYGLLNLAEADGRLDGSAIAQSRRVPRITTGGLEYTARVVIRSYSETEIAERLGYPKGDDKRIRPRERSSIIRAIEDLQTQRWLTIESKVFDPKTKEYRSAWMVEKDAILRSGIRDGQRFYSIHPSVFAEQVGNFWMLPVPGVRYEKALAAVGGKRLLDEYGNLEEYCRFIAAGRHAKESAELRSVESEPVARGDISLEQRLQEKSLFRGVGWTKDELKKRGVPYFRKKLHRALDFVVALEDVLESWGVEEDDGKTMYTLKLRDPGAALERHQYTLLGGDA